MHGGSGAICRAFCYINMIGAYETVLIGEKRMAFLIEKKNKADKQ